VLLFNYSVKRERHPLFVTQVIPTWLNCRTQNQELSDSSHAGRHVRLRVEDGSREQNFVSVNERPISIDNELIGTTRQRIGRYDALVSRT